MKKRLKLIIAVFMAVVFFAGTVHALENTGAFKVTVVDGEKTIVYNTDAKTLAEFFQNAGITIKEFDVVTPPPETAVQNGMTVVIARGLDIIVNVHNLGGVIKHYVTVKPGTLLAVLNEFSARTGMTYAHDYILPFRTEAVNGMTLELRPITETLNEYTEIIPFVTEIIYSDEILIGESLVLMEGIDGQIKKTEKITFEAGYEVARQVISTETVLSPVNAVVLIGTRKDEADENNEQGGGTAAVPEAMLIPEKKAEDKPPPEIMGAAFVPEPVIDGVYFQFSKELVMSATAYTSDYASTGKNPGDKWFGITATGMKAQVGVVAVDPTVIPLYTKLYIEGYGFAIAGDVGKSVKGLIIDLYFNTPGEVKTFGRQNRKVYILSDQDFEIALIK